MRAGRNDPCPCGSGLKYKRCCISHDEGLQREHRAAEAERDRALAEPAREEEIVAALAKGLDAVVARDRATMSHLLEHFAALLAVNALLADLRFDDAAFADVVTRSLRVLGRARGATARRRLFLDAIPELADRRVLKSLRTRLVRITEAAALSPSNREAVAAALVCLAPVLEERPLPASESPTVELIFNAQLDDWLKRRLHVANEIDDVAARLATDG